MTEDEARGALDVPRETFDRLDAFAAFLAAENERQNLVSRGSLEQLWTRHIFDSAQLLRFVPAGATTWLDLGTGAGFPGLMVALLHAGPMVLIEQRRLRVEFLQRAAAELELGPKVRILCANARQVSDGPFDVISARAFAPLDRLFAVAAHLGTKQTRWVLPKGRNAKSELDAARASWQGEFRLEPSVTDPEASIIVAEQVRPRRKGLHAG